MVYVVGIVRVNESLLNLLFQAVTLLAFNKTDNIPELWEVVSSVYAEPEYQVVAARRLREAMMKASILVGFPRVPSRSPLY